MVGGGGGGGVSLLEFTHHITTANRNPHGISDIFITAVENSTNPPRSSRQSGQFIGILAGGDKAKNNSSEQLALEDELITLICAPTQNTSSTISPFYQTLITIKVRGGGGGS